MSEQDLEQGGQEPTEDVEAHRKGGGSGKTPMANTEPTDASQTGGDDDDFEAHRKGVKAL